MNEIQEFWANNKEWLVPVAFFILTGLINLLTRKRSVEEWVAFGEQHPRSANVIRMVRAFGFDPVKLIKSGIAFIEAKNPNSLPPKR